MKYFLVIVLIMLVAACGQEKKEKTDSLAYAVITGHIKNREIYPRQQSLKVIIPSFEDSEAIQECEIKEDGTFSFRFQPLALRDISIETFIPYILIRPGDSLHIELDFENLNKVVFSGTAGKLNQDLYTFTDGGGYHLHLYSGTDDLMMEPAAFRAKLDEERKIPMERFHEFSRKYKVAPDLEKWISKGLDIEYYSYLIDYGVKHALFCKDTVSDEYYNFQSNAEKLFTEDVIHSGLFELASKFQSKPKMSVDSLKSTAAILERSAYYSTNKVLSQFMVAADFDWQLNCNDVTFFEDNQAFFDEQVTLPLLRENLLQKYKDKKAYVTNPKPMSDFMLYGSDLENGITPVVGEGMKKLQDVVTRNKGKVTLINFWSGCPFALAELKGMNELTEEYKDEDVALVSIAGDSDQIRKWNDNLKGQSNIWPYDNIREILNNWHVHKSPYYLLINKEGVIVDYGTHIRPSDASVKEKINRLLKD